MRNKTITAAAMLITMIMLLYACLKGSAASSGGESVRYTVNEWKKSWTAQSSKETLLFRKILGELDYAESLQIIRNDRSVLTLVRIDDDAGSTARYLGIAGKENVYALEGIFSARDMDLIQTFYSIGVLPSNESLLVSDMNDYPIFGYKTDAAGKMRSLFPVSGSRKNNDAVLK